MDFPLSDLRNSGIDDVWLSVQFRAQDLADAVGKGKPQDLDRHHGGFRLVVPEQGIGSVADDGFVSGPSRCWSATPRWGLGWSRGPPPEPARCSPRVPG